MDENGVPIWDEIYPCEFFAEDIENNRLYVFMEEDDLVLHEYGFEIKTSR